MPNLDLIAAAQERKMLETFNAIVGDIKNQSVLSEITRALEVGDVDAVIRLLGLDEETWEPMGEAIRESYRTGGITGANQIGTIPTNIGTLVMRFNMRNPRAEQWIQDASSNLITEVVEDQRQAVKDELQAGLERGDNPRTTALNIVGRIDPATKKREGGIIGLTSQQSNWMRNARAELESLDSSYFERKLRDRRLDKKIRRAIENGEPLDQKTIDAAIVRMQQRALKYRGDVISRTESINALRAGQYESIAQAVERGELMLDEVKKTWSANLDGREREAHLLADIQYKDGIQLDQPFIVGGKQMMYCGDPQGGAANVVQCRCSNSYSLDFGKKLARVEGFR